MARFINTSALTFWTAALILAASIAVSTAQYAGIVDTVSSPVSAPISFEVAFPPEASPGLFEYLESCARKMEDECGEETVGFLFSDEPVMTDTCCMQLVGMGKACHQAMVKMTLSLPDFKPYASMALPKSDQLWNKCELISHEGLQLAPAYN